jgi:hypothetical protein
VLKLLVGIIKGAVIGAALGFGAYQLRLATGFAQPWLVYGLIGAVVGLFVGKPIWKLIADSNSTSWVAILKGAVGFGIGIGLYALVTRVLNLNLQVSGFNVFTWEPTLGGAIGAVYGGFVELDDAIGDDGVPKRPAADKPSGAAPKKK